MRSLSLALLLVVIAAPAFAGTNIGLLPAFRNVAAQDENYAQRYYAQPIAAQANQAQYAQAYSQTTNTQPYNAPQYEARPVQNYQVPGIPDYLPMSRTSAQQAYAQPQQQQYPLMAQEPAYAPQQYQQQGYQQQVAAYPAQVQQPYQTQYPQQYQQQQAVAPAYSYVPQGAAQDASPYNQQMPQQQEMVMAPQASMPYHPPTMQGNPRYEYIDGPSAPSSSPMEPARPNMAMSSGTGREGIFASLRSGLTFPGDTSFATAAGRWDQEYHMGWGLHGGIGYGFRPMNQWVAPRIEAEFGTTHQGVKTHKVIGLTFEDPDAFGNVDTMTGLFGGYLDFMPFARTFVPYIGAGAGFANTRFDRHGVVGTVVSDDSWGFAWRGDIGLGIVMGGGSVVEIGYRYLAAPDVEVEARDGTTHSTEVNSHNLLIGWRQHF